MFGRGSAELLVASGAGLVAGGSGWPPDPYRRDATRFKVA
jgi:hypothetical protein